MRKSLIVVSLFTINLFLFTSCDWAKNKTKSAVSKTGEVIGKTGSEFGNGVYNGVKNTFDNKIEISDELKIKGFDIGEVTINSTDSTTDNILTIYTIFHKDFKENLVIKVFNEDGKEYGRASKIIKGLKNEAQYVDFYFDPRVTIERKGIITIE